jgi:hypothetical protein
MEQFLPLIKDTLVSAVLAEATRRAQKRSIAGLVLYVLAGFVLALALGFLSIACYDWLLTKYSTQASAGICAAILAGVAVVVLAGAHYLRTRNRGADEMLAGESMQQLMAAVSDAAEQLPHELAVPVKENPKTSLALAAVAGLLVGNRIH